MDRAVAIATPGPCLPSEGMKLNDWLNQRLPNATLFINRCCSYRFEDYVPVPDRLPMAVAVGKNANNLRPIFEGIECVIVTSDRKTKEVRRM